MRKRIAVAGATGYLGKHLVRELSQAGWWVRALARDRAKLSDVAPYCDEIFEFEATQRKGLEAFFADVDHGFSSIGIRHFKRHPSYEEVDYGANVNLPQSSV